MFTQSILGQAAMRRVQFIEIHEQPWFPSSIRDGITDALQFGFNLLNAYAPIAPLLQSALDSARAADRLSTCVPAAADPGSIFLESIAERRDPPGLQIWLTDKYPNLGAIAKCQSGF